MAPAVLSAEQQQKVNKFLKFAQSSINSGRLVFPPNSNAVYVYRLILDIDPGNEQARAGLKKVLQIQVDKAKQLKKTGDTEAFDKHLEVSLDVFPNSKALQALL